MDAAREILGLALVVLGMVIVVIAILRLGNENSISTLGLDTIIAEIAKKSPLLAVGVLCMYFGFKLMGIDLSELDSPSPTASPTPT